MKRANMNSSVLKSVAQDSLCNNGGNGTPAGACGSACGTKDPKPTACGSACGTKDPKPTACGSACGAK